MLSTPLFPERRISRREPKERKEHREREDYESPRHHTDQMMDLAGAVVVGAMGIGMMGAMSNMFKK